MAEPEQPNESNGVNEHFAFVRHAWITQQGPYGLEEHLKSFRDTPGFEGLYASWGCDKVKFREMLQGAGANNPHYSEHGETHSKQIVACIELLLGEKRIRQLSASDAWLLLQCAYTHDFGMAMSASEMVDRFAKEGKDFLKNMERRFQETNDKAALSAFKHIKPILEYAQKMHSNGGRPLFAEEDKPRSIRMDEEKKWEVYDDGSLCWPSDFIEKFITVQESWFRPQHGEDSRQILTAKAYAGSREDAIIPLRLRLMIARIAGLHTRDREELLELPQQDLGVCNDHIHPRFAAILLRLGDLLDMDNGRFSRAQLLRIGGANEGSLIHMFKHEAITHFLITPREVSVKAVFDPDFAKHLLNAFPVDGFKIIDDDKKETKGLNEKTCSRLCMKACQELFRWLDWLEKDLNFFARNWLEIVPRKLGGGCPTYQKPEVSIKDKDKKEKKVTPEELKLEYSISPTRATEIIEGSGLYQRPRIVFLRELLQNALDATKIQMNRDVLGGRHEGFLEADWSVSEDEVRELTPYCYLEKLLPALGDYRIEYTVRVAPERDPPLLQILLRDYGIGINEENLKGMLKIGDIQTPELDLDILRMPSWLIPTRSFGIGLQSVFYLVKSFKIRSRARYEPNHPFPPLREMEFYSNRFGGEIDVQLCDEKTSASFGFGTEVRIEIPIIRPQDQLDALQDPEISIDLFDKNLWHLEDYFDKQMRELDIPQTLLPLRRRMPRQASICKHPDDLAQADPPFGGPEDMLQDIFGDFCVLLLNDKPPLVKPEGPLRRRTDTFSCWNDEHQLLLKYSRIKQPESALHAAGASRVRVFYKGIEIGEQAGANLRPAVCIPFWEVEIHLYAKHAKYWLEINRDRILQDRVEVLARMVHASHLGLLRYAFSKEASVANYIWDPKDDNHEALKYYYRLAKLHSAYYISSLLGDCPEAIKILGEDGTRELHGIRDGIPCYHYALGSDRLRYTDDPDSMEESLRLLHQNDPGIWFVVDGALPGMDRELAVTVPITTFTLKTSFTLIPHLLLRYGFAAKRFFALRLRNTVVPCFRIGERKGALVEVYKSDDNDDYNDYWDYVLSIINRGQTHERPFFPSHEAFAGISVNRLPTSQGSDEIRVFDSWIISPLPCGELWELIKESKNASPGRLDIPLNRALPEKWTDKHGMLLRFIQFNSVSNMGNRSTAREMSKKEKCEIWRSYVIFLKQLQKHIP